MALRCLHHGLIHIWLDIEACRTETLSTHYRCRFKYYFVDGDGDVVTSQVVVAHSPLARKLK